MPTVIVDKILDWIQHPFGTGVLTSDGVQWTTAVDTTTADTDVVIATATIEPITIGGGPGGQGTILEVEFGLTAGLKAVSSATADLIWKWQARNKDGTWVNLHTAVTETNIGTTEVERTRSGRFTPETNFNAMPCDIKLILQCNETNEGRGRVKNSSYIKVTYRIA